MTVLLQVVSVGWAKRSAGPPAPGKAASPHGGPAPGLATGGCRVLMVGRRGGWWWAGAPLGPPYGYAHSQRAHCWLGLPIAVSVYGGNMPCPTIGDITCPA